MKILKTTLLKEKGWTEQEIERAKNIIEKHEWHDVFFSKIVFWSALLVTIFANLLVSLILIPFLIVLNEWVLFSVVALLGLMIGFVYNFLITDIGHLEKKHHVWAGIILPIITLANLAVMVIYSNRFITELKVNNPLHNPWLIAGLFSIMFILPYLVSRFRKM